MDGEMPDGRPCASAEALMTIDMIMA
jgi:hypothetical protein